MLDAARTARDFVRGRTREDLDQDRMLSFALVRAIEVLGEAAGRVSAETRLASPETPWALIVAMRNRLIHGYFDINHDILWQTVHEELPPLLAQLEKLTRDLGDPADLA